MALFVFLLALLLVPAVLWVEELVLFALADGQEPHFSAGEIDRIDHHFNAIAHHQALMVESSQIVRGQEMPPVRRALILGGVIVTSGVLGGVIGYNIQDDSAS